MKIVFIVLLLFIFLSCQRDNYPIPPVEPVNLTATAVSISEVNLAWTDRSTNESGFTIERRTGAEKFQKIISVEKDVTSFSDKGLLKNTLYTYRVFAFNVGGPSFTYTNEASAKTMDDIPVAIRNLTANAVSSNCIELTWSDRSINESGYKIERKIQDGTYSVIATLPANSIVYADTGLNESTLYFYRAYPFNDFRNASYSNEAFDTTMPDLKSDLLAYYSFSGNVLDSSGNNLHPDCTNCNSFTTDRKGNANRAYYFGGLNTIMVKDDDRLDSLPLTISLWFNYISSEQITINALISRYPRFQTRSWYILNLISNLQFYYSNSYPGNPNGGTISSSGSSQDSSFVVPNSGDGKWHHLAVVFHPVEGGHLYLDGTWVGSKPWVGTPGTVRDFSSPMYFGYLPTYPTTPESGHYIGKLDEIRIYNRALSASAIRSLSKQ